MNKPRVLLLSATTGYQLRSFDDAADHLGIEVVFATDRCHQLDDPWRDRAIPVRFHQQDASLEHIVAACRRAPVDGVLAVGDRPTALAARVAERLGLRGHPPHAALASGNKCETRARFRLAGLTVPWNFVLPLDADPRETLAHADLQFPCVLKPLGLSGSRGVIRADGETEFVAAFERIRALLRRLDVRASRTGLNDTVLVEGFVPGREFAIEGVLTEGALQAFAIFDKPDPLDGPFFEETIYVTPSSLSEVSQVTVLHTVENAAKALGLWHGPIHAECRINPDGVVMLEIAARPIGGLCSKALRFRGGMPLEQILLHHAIGDDISTVTRESAASAVMMIPIPKRGLFKHVDGLEEASAVEGVEEIIITAKPDQLIEPLPEAGSYLGFIFARGYTPSQAETAVRRAHHALRFHIDPALAVSAIRR